MSLQSRVAFLSYGHASTSYGQRPVNKIPATSTTLAWNTSKRASAVIAAAERNENAKKEVRLDDLDLMALEFGRLLGESKEKTMSKVVKKKIDPGATYIGIEKQAKGNKESTMKQVTIQPPKREATRNLVRENGYTSISNLPPLTSPPIRQKVSLTGQKSDNGRLDDSLLQRPKKSGQILSGQNKSTDLSKSRFQSLLQESFDATREAVSSDSSNGNLSNLLSGPMETVEKEKKEVRMKLSSPARYQSVSTESRHRLQPEGNGPNDTISSSTELLSEVIEIQNQNAVKVAKKVPHSSSVLPSLASPPSRQKGSSGMFPNASLRRSRVLSQSSIDEDVDGLLLRKPTLGQPQASDETTSLCVSVTDGMQSSQSEDENLGDLLQYRRIEIENIETIKQEQKLDETDVELGKFDAERPTLDVDLNEASVHLKLSKPKLPSQSNIAILTNTQVQFQSVEVDLEEANIANVEENTMENMEMDTSAKSQESLIDQIEVSSEESNAIKNSHGNDEKQLTVSAFAHNEITIETGSSSIKASDISKEILRKPSQPHSSQFASMQLKQKAKEISKFLAKEDEEREWARADALLKSKEQVDVQLIGSNSAGLFATFGCLVGFLPLFELSQRRGYVDFSTWAQQKGINLKHRDQSVNAVVTNGQVSVTNNDGALTGDIEAFRRMYNEEMLKLTSTFVGEKARVVVKQVDKNARRLKFSEKEADPDSRDLILKKAELMAELKVGDVVTCEVKSMTPIGVFVELDGVSALIHHSEISWNVKVDVSSLLYIGQVIKARVCRLDRNLQRISLSLKQMQPDPLMRTLESVVGNAENDALQDLEMTESEAVVWPELENLVRELEKMECVSAVYKGRCLCSTALAPTFQVFLSTAQTDGYKLLARFGNEIQEVVVKADVDREKIKECIRSCTLASA